MLSEVSGGVQVEASVEQRWCSSSLVARRRKLFCVWCVYILLYLFPSLSLWKKFPLIFLDTGTRQRERNQWYYEAFNLKLEVFTSEPTVTTSSVPNTGPRLGMYHQLREIRILLIM